MAVPVFTMVNAGLAMTFLGGGLLLLIALWWTLAGDGIEIPRSSVARGAAFGAMAGWLLWAGWLGVKDLGHLGMVGVARW